ncbi:MAG: glycosyltransferase, partial [Parvibaculaceae bacterium]
RSDLRAFVRQIRAADADVYHCVQASLGAYLAQRAMPDRAQVVECVDPRDWNDWLIDFRLPTHSAARLIPSFVYFGTRPARLSVRRADAVQVPARFLQAKVQRLYGLGTCPQFAPMPFDAPGTVTKSATPLVIFVGRLVPRKRPEIVLELARQFPAVRFMIVGDESGRGYGSELRRQAAALPNVIFSGFIDQMTDARLFDHLGEAWILVNTAAREGLPLTFIEAASHRCAILSECDPDGYASKFGYHVRDGDFASGLKCLLSDDAWRSAGERAYTCVARDHAPGNAGKIQLAIYADALARSAGRRSMTRATRRWPV